MWCGCGETTGRHSSKSSSRFSATPGWLPRHRAADSEASPRATSLLGAANTPRGSSASSLRLAWPPSQAGSWRNGPGIFANGLPGNYGHNHPRQVPVRYLGDNDGLRCVFTHRSSSTFSVVAGRIATCCACAACKPLIGDAARPSRLASQNLSRTPARRKPCQSTKQGVYWPTFGYRCRSVRPTEMPRLTQATPRDPGV